MRIKHNPASASTLRHLAEAQQELSQSLNRMASGQRINRAADDPSGLAVSEKLRAEIASVKQAIDNTAVSVTMVQTAEGLWVRSATFYWVYASWRLQQPTPLSMIMMP